MRAVRIAAVLRARFVTFLSVLRYCFALFCDIISQNAFCDCFAVFCRCFVKGVLCNTVDFFCSLKTPAIHERIVSF